MLLLISEHVFGTLDFSRRDLPALNIQRSRDHGLPGYNDIREAYGLPRVNWDGINNNTGNINPDLPRVNIDISLRRDSSTVSHCC